MPKTIKDLREREITVTSYWYPHEIRAMCIKYGYYENGTNDEYDMMLTFVDKEEPSLQNIYKVAADIWMHSRDLQDDITIDEIMVDVNECVHTFFRVR